MRRGVDWRLLFRSVRRPCRILSGGCRALSSTSKGNQWLAFSESQPTLSYDDFVNKASNCSARLWLLLQIRAPTISSWRCGAMHEETLLWEELVHWAKYDVERAIPSLVDGLKPGQRKARGHSSHQPRQTSETAHARSSSEPS